MHLESNRFHTGLITVQIIQHFHLKTFSLDPAAVHTVQHTTPVTGFGTARTGIELHDGIIFVVLAVQQSLDADVLKCFDKIIQHFLNLRDQFRIFFLVSHLDQCFHIFLLGNKLVVHLEIRL